MVVVSYVYFDSVASSWALCALAHPTMATLHGRVMPRGINFRTTLIVDQPVGGIIDDTNTTDYSHDKISLQKRSCLLHSKVSAIELLMPALPAVLPAFLLLCISVDVVTIEPHVHHDGDRGVG